MPGGAGQGLGEPLDSARDAVWVLLWKGWFPLPQRTKKWGTPWFLVGVSWGPWSGLDPHATGVLHSLKQDEHLTGWGLREQVHGHSLDWPEGTALHPVPRGPAEVHTTHILTVTS